MSDEPESEICDPTWEAAIAIWLGVIENPNANSAVQQVARDEIMKAGYMIDVLQEKLVRSKALVGKHHAAGIFDGIGAGDDCPVCKKEKS
jgi:hypothetical protein